MAIMNTHLDWREFPFLDVEVSPNIVPRCLESRNLMESLKMVTCCQNHCMNMWN